MKQVIISLIIFLSSLILSACASTSTNIEITYSGEKPAFITDIGFEINKQLDQTHNVICVAFNEPELWESGTFADKLNDHLAQNSRLFIDNREMTLDNMASISLLSLRIIGNDEGTPEGSYSDLKLCYDADNLNPGTYAAHFDTSNLNGKKYHFDFQVNAK
jgi:hypothetical protein